MNTLIINVHEQIDETSTQVERRHYSVAQLIAELQKYDGSSEIVIKNLNTGKYGSIDFQGLSTERVEE